MDETDDSRDRGPDAGHEQPAAAPEHDRTTADGSRYDPETVESTVQDVDGIEYEQGGGNVAGASPGADLGPVEPETPTLEGALFVLLGVVLTVVVLAQLVGL
ncbi:DUF7312 domain-containing protein [Haloglomus litoreum]|uniref:DUF7312 domain-containing protein n=1 Tax=Haloglomus litoreum TaxID=3034026 RepID=UPI0023E859DF|nr:hypothetical protein [Haloglomus sp. DT116]